MTSPDAPVKCVAWDLDNTLWSGIALESGDGLPELDESALRLLDELAERGILNSITSQNPPDVLARVERHPRLAGRFLAPQVGWGRKSAALQRLAQQLNIGLETIVFVDDDPFERAEVAHTLGVVRTTTRAELAALLADPAFGGGRTDESRRRAELYRAGEQRRAEAAAHGGSYDDFLRQCEIVATFAQATPDEADRLAELAARTNQFNSTRLVLDRQAFLDRIASPDHLVVSMRLRDRFADDGLVATAVVDRWRAARPVVKLLCVSCRTIGRGGAKLLLVALLRALRREGAEALVVPCLLDDRNLPLRVALRDAGFTAERDPGDAQLARFSRSVDSPPGYPDWLTVA